MIPKPHCEITYEWLRSRGFRIERPNVDYTPHMAVATSSQDSQLLEVAPMAGLMGWHCWLRDDMACKRGKFVHIRHVSQKADLEALFQAIAGNPLPIEDYPPERFAKALAEMSQECERAWSNYCNEELLQDVRYKI